MKLTPASVQDPKAGLELEKQKLKRACEDFETIMTTYLLKSMNDTVLRTESEAFGSGRDLYEGMMVESVAAQLSHTQGIGLARLLYEQLEPGLEARKTGPNLMGAESLTPQAAPSHRPQVPGPGREAEEANEIQVPPPFNR